TAIANNDGRIITAPVGTPRSRERCWGDRRGAHGARAGAGGRAERGRVIRRRVVRVPASSANLGPGFDCMAAAISLALQLEVEETGEFRVESRLPIAR